MPGSSGCPTAWTAVLCFQGRDDCLVVRNCLRRFVDDGCGIHVWTAITLSGGAFVDILCGTFLKTSQYGVLTEPRLEFI